MAKIILSGYIVVPEADLAAVREVLPAHIDLTRQEPGCLVFTVTEHPMQVGRFEVYEEFCDQAAFEAHQRRSHHSHWATVSKNVARYYTVTGLNIS